MKGIAYKDDVMDRTAFVIPLRVSLFPLVPLRSRARISKCNAQRTSMAAKRVIWVPNHVGKNVAEQDELYKRVTHSLPNWFNVQMLSTIPNPYDSNTKRWERVWLSMLRDAIGGHSNVCVLGHGSGADACLRLLEDERIDGDGGFVCVLPTSDEYYAGERHGRAYHWDSIRDHVGSGRIALITSTRFASRAENSVLVERLGASMVVDISTTNADELEAVVCRAIRHGCGEERC